jgi:hypothetical protein
METLKSISTIDDFKNHIKSIFLGEEFLEKLNETDSNWENDWKTYLNKLINVNKGLIDITEKCIDEQRILWVIGY